MKAISREELEAAFPWVRHLPPAAVDELTAKVEDYRKAAKIYARLKDAAEQADPAKAERMIAYVEAQAEQLPASHRYR